MPYPNVSGHTLITDVFSEVFILNKNLLYLSITAVQKVKFISPLGIEQSVKCPGMGMLTVYINLLAHYNHNKGLNSHQLDRHVGNQRPIISRGQTHWIQSCRETIGDI
jgi:hypothetical protein